MKRAIIVSVLLIAAQFASPLRSGTAIPTPKPKLDVDQNFAPGSIVQFERLTIEDGLSQNAGLAIFQDSRGYLWIGSQDGLNRYDGYTFKIYKHDPDDPASISHNSILSIVEDTDGSLWFGTWGGGLNRFDPVTEAFTRYLPDPDDPASLSEGTISSLKIDSAGTLWVATLNGLDRFNRETNGFDHFRNDPADRNSLGSNAISFLFEDSYKQLWVGTGAFNMEGAGLSRFDPASGTFTHYQHNESDPESLASNNIASIAEAPDGTFWIATGGFSLHGNGLDQFDPLTGKAKHFVTDPEDKHSLSGNDLMRLWLESDGTLWVGAWATGLNRMSLSDPGHFTRYQNDPYFSDSLSGDEVWSLFQDHTGILWIGTAHSGVNKLSANSGQFSLYRNNPAKPNSLGINTVGSFAEDKQGNIWIATWGGGLDRFDPRTGEFTHYRHDPADPNSLADDLFMAVCVDSYNTVWAGTLGRGLDRLNPATGRVTHYLHDPSDPNSLADDNIAAVISDGNNGLWVGTFGGLSHYDPNTRTFTNYSNDPSNPASLSHNMVVSLFIDSRNTLWVGTWGGGLNQLDLNDPLHSNPETATLKRYRHNPDDSSTLSEDSVWSIHESADGILWLGTQLGLNRFDPRTGNFKHYTEKSGLPNNTVLGILGDDDDNLWITTNNGLAKFDPRGETFRNFDASDGLQSNEFNSNAYFRAHDGVMYVGGINGFNLFQPAEVQPNRVPPQVVVTGFSIFNEPALVDLTGRKPIQLSYKQDFISFEFAAFDFQAPQKNQYAYKLDGFHEDWVMAGDHRIATFTNLPGGEYVFHVKAANSDGVWNETGVAIPITVVPPVWQTWWFLTALVIGAGALLAGGFRYRLNSIREQNVYLETQISERTSDLREANKQLEREVEQRKRAEAALEKRAAEELQQSEARFEAAFQSSAIGIALTTVDGHLLRANPAVCAMSGYTEEELKTRTDFENTHPEDRHIGMDLLAELMEGRRESYQVQKRYLRKNGEVFWSQVTLSTVKDAVGKVRYLVAMVEDIEEQKRNLASLRESEARFRAMFENAAIGIALVGMDRRPIAANDAIIKMTGYSPEEFFKTSGADLSHPADADIGIAELQEVVAGRLDSYQIEKRYVRKNGEIYWVRLMNSVVRTPGGSPQYFVVMIEDINRQKRTLDDLRESEARFRALYDNVSIGMAVVSLDRHIINVNQVAVYMTGYDADELLGRDPAFLSHPEDIQIGMEQFREMVAGNIPSFQMQKRFIRKDGSFFWGRVTYSLVPDKDGHPLHLVGFIEDATEEIVSRQKLAEQEADYLRMLQLRVKERTQELEQSNRQLHQEIEQRTRVEKELAEKAAEEAVAADRTRLARDLHDAVTQTLFSASLTAEVLPDLWDMDVEEAKRSTEELRQLTRGALAEMRTLLLELRPAALTQTRLNDLIKQLCEAFIGRSRLPITLNTTGERNLPPEVQIAFYRVAQESLNNVFKYARATQVDVNLALSPNNVQFEVCDNGVGFDMATSKPTSLGMRIMRERAESIGADLQITSEPGKGTCVAMTWRENPD